MGGLSWWHWLVIGGAFILLFGAKKLPDAARGLGRSLRILKSEVSAMNEEVDDNFDRPHIEHTRKPPVSPRTSGLGTVS